MTVLQIQPKVTTAFPTFSAASSTTVAATPRFGKNRLLSRTLLALAMLGLVGCRGGSRDSGSANEPKPETEPSETAAAKYPDLVKPANLPAIPVVSIAPVINAHGDSPVDSISLSWSVDGTGTHYEGHEQAHRDKPKVTYHELYFHYGPLNTPKGEFAARPALLTQRVSVDIERAKLPAHLQKKTDGQILLWLTQDFLRGHLPEYVSWGWQLATDKYTDAADIQGTLNGYDPEYKVNGGWSNVPPYPGRYDNKHPRFETLKEMGIDISPGYTYVSAFDTAQSYQDKGLPVITLNHAFDEIVDYVPFQTSEHGGITAREIKADFNLRVDTAKLPKGLAQLRNQEVQENRILYKFVAPAYRSRVRELWPMALKQHPGDDMKQVEFVSEGLRKGYVRKDGTPVLPLAQDPKILQRGITVKSMDNVRFHVDPPTDW